MTKASLFAIISLAVADVAHPVERHLAKVEVASSSLVTRSIKQPLSDGQRLFLFLSKYSTTSKIKKEKAPAKASAFSGATGRTRTGDLLITNQLLYQLSHSSITAGAISGYYSILFVFFCQDIIQKNLPPARAAAGRPPAAADRCVKYSFSAQRAPFFRCARSAPAKRRGSLRSCPASGRGKTAA